MALEVASNSRDTNINLNTVFTGSTLDLHSLPYAKVKSVTVTCAASHAGTISLQVSDNDTDWVELKSVAVSAGSIFTRTRVDVHRRYYHTVYTNGGTTTTSFSLKTYVHDGAQGTVLCDNSGRPLTSTETGNVNALDVNVASPLNITVALDNAQDSVRSILYD